MDDVIFSKPFFEIPIDQTREESRIFSIRGKVVVDRILAEANNLGLRGYRITRVVVTDCLEYGLGGQQVELFGYQVRQQIPLDGFISNRDPGDEDRNV